jgi:excisionase family DNA binding protein
VANNKQAPKTFCTTREAAEILSVSLRTAQLWTESGLLEAWKTEGGHRRISRQSIERLLADPTVRELPKAEESPPQVLKVLVVEDDPALRRLYEVNIRRWPMPLVFSSADDGYEALIRIGHDKPDLLIADLQMPGMDGFRMLYTLCSMSELSGMQIVVVSGLDPAVISAHGGVPEGIPVFPKPIPFAHLLDIAKQTVTDKQLKIRESL